MDESKVELTTEDLQEHDALAAVIRDDSGSVLMLEHRKFGFWTIPLGKALHGQAPLEGLAMELREELGIDLIAATERRCVRLIYWRQGREVPLDLHLIDVDAFSGHPQNLEADKHARLKYMTIGEIADLEATSDGTLLLMEELGVSGRAAWTGKRNGSY